MLDLDRDTLTLGLLLAGFVVLPAVTYLLATPFWNEVAMRIMLLGLAAMGLNFILGHGGLVSFGHAAYIGLGAYTTAIMAQHGWTNGYLQLLMAMAVAAVVGGGIGVLVLRVTRLYFIMITLAFAQMLYFLFVSLEYYGGDDGLHVAPSRFVPFAFDEPGSLHLYYAICVVLIGTAILLVRLTHSPFGVVLRAAKDNAVRVRASGIDPQKYRLVAYVLSAVIASVAGVLFANWQQYVSPDVMHWTRSGELLVIVALGGIASQAGPLLGAVVFLLAEEMLYQLLFAIAPDANLAQHWMFLFGAMLVAVVLFARGGLMGFIGGKA